MSVTLRKDVRRRGSRSAVLGRRGQKHPSKLRVHFSSERGDHRTPKFLYDLLNRQYKFKADLAASKENALHKKYFSIKNSAFENPWPKGYSFCNPPYGRGLLQWCGNAATYCKLGSYTVMLLPARTDTKWFHNYVLPYAAEIVFIEGRLTFQGNSDPAPFPSMLVIWGKRKGTVKISTLRRDKTMPKKAKKVVKAKAAKKVAKKVKAKKETY